LGHRCRGGRALGANFERKVKKIPLPPEPPKNPKKSGKVPKKNRPLKVLFLAL